MKTSEILNGAADIIERDGWYCGGYGADASDEGALLVGVPVCAMGALYGAAGRPLQWAAGIECWTGASEDADTAGLVFATYLAKDVPGWNDTPGRSANDVVEALRACALIEAAKELDVRVVTPEQVTA